MATTDDDSVRRVRGDARLGPGTITYAFVTGFVSILATVDGHAWLFPARFEYLDIVSGWWIVYLLVYAPAAIVAAVVGLLFFRLLRGRVAQQPTTLAFTYAISLALSFAAVGVAIGLLVHDATWIIVTSIVALLAGVGGYALARAETSRRSSVS